jgi:uncharacterized DUF497 family protein
VSDSGCRKGLLHPSNKSNTLMAIRFEVFVEQDESSIRIISARRATANERRRYEEGDA